MLSVFIISAINHSVASSWFLILYTYAMMYVQTHIKEPIY